jgi:hypothetical protein
MSLWPNTYANAYSDCNADSNANIDADCHTYLDAQGDTDPENSANAAPSPHPRTPPVVSASAKETQYPIRLPRLSQLCRFICSTSKQIDSRLRLTCI